MKATGHMSLLDTCNVVSATEELNFQLYLNSYVWLVATSPGRVAFAGLED